MISSASEWQQLYETANDQYRKFYYRDWFVKKSIPILYSGNLAEYKHSERKIVTVSLNPSSFEFLDENPELPYDIREYSTSYTSSELQKAYSSYFERRPYTKWFNEAYEKLLQFLDASYYGENYPKNEKVPSWWKVRPNRALHTDLCTPLVTCPNWSGLNKKIQDELCNDGSHLWHSLMSTLRPHLILISVGKRYLAQISDVDWKPNRPADLDRNGQELKVGKLGNGIIVWGKQQVRPFFHFADHEKEALAKSILSLLSKDSAENRADP